MNKTHTECKSQHARRWWVTAHQSFQKNLLIYACSPDETTVFLMHLIISVEIVEFAFVLSL